MTSNDVNLAILQAAEELVINDYITKRVELHNQWKKQSELLWRTRGIELGYPPIPPFPTEDDICAQANKLWRREENM